MDDWIPEYCLKILHTGSRVVCNPPPTDTDDDYLLLVDPLTLPGLEDRLTAEGFKIGGSFGAGRRVLEEWPDLNFARTKRDKAKIFRSYKKKELNYIVTCSLEYFEEFTHATQLAKHLNLLKKPDRIALFHAIVFNEWTD